MGVGLAGRGRNLRRGWDGGTRSSWVFAPPQGVGRRTLQLWAARGAFRVQPGLPPVSADVLLRSQPIRGRVTARRLQGRDASCGCGRHAASLHKQRAAGLQTERPRCGQDTVCGSRSAASCCLSFSCLSYRNDIEEGLCCGREAASRVSVEADDPGSCLQVLGD